MGVGWWRWWGFDTYEDLLLSVLSFRIPSNTGFNG